MIITELATNVLKQLLLKNNAKYLALNLIGNKLSGFQFEFSFLDDFPANKVLLNCQVSLIADIKTYFETLKMTLDYDIETNELQFYLRND